MTARSIGPDRPHCAASPSSDRRQGRHDSHPPQPRSSRWRSPPLQSARC
jgi:hypothetical protein